MKRLLKHIIIILGLFLLIIMTIPLIFIIKSSTKKELAEEDLKNLPGKLVKLSIGETYYEEYGPKDGEVVFCVHGSIVYHIVWERNIQALADAGYRVIVYDQYGRGFSERPKINYTLDVYLKQIDELRKYLNIEKMNIMGISMGGGLAVAYAGQNLDLIKSILLISSVVPEVLHRDFDSIKVERRSYTPLERYKKLKNSNLNLLMQESKNQFKYKGVEWAIFSAIRNREKFSLEPLFDLVGKSKVPILLIWGRNDTVLPLRLSEVALNYFPHAEFHIIEDAGHSANWEQPQIVNPMILDFLEKNKANE